MAKQKDNNKEIKYKIKEIDKTIQKLQKEKNSLLLKIKEDNILDRIANLCKLNWEHEAYVQNPFYVSEEKFKKQLNKKNTIIDNFFYLNMDPKRHQTITIDDIANNLWESSENEDMNDKVTIFYDRISKKSFDVTIKEALEELEKWALKSKIHTWKFDW